MSPDPHFSALSEEEVSWLADLVAHAETLGVDVTDAASIGVAFDSALADVASGDQPPEIGNAVVNTVAAVLGEHLRLSCGVEWALVTDELGTDLCLKSPGSSFTLFPQSSVAKRWEAQETGWVVPFCAWAQEAVR